MSAVSDIVNANQRMLITRLSDVGVDADEEERTGARWKIKEGKDGRLKLMRRMGVNRKKKEKEEGGTWSGGQSDALLCPRSQDRTPVVAVSRLYVLACY
jgi:hypothetical protein